jgi:hypothetical protein
LGVKNVELKDSLQTIEKMPVQVSTIHEHPTDEKGLNSNEIQVFIDIMGEGLFIGFA